MMNCFSGMLAGLYDPSQPMAGSFLVNIYSVSQ
jgi:hypothetical protein